MHVRVLAGAILAAALALGCDADLPTPSAGPSETGAPTAAAAASATPGPATPRPDLRATPPDSFYEVDDGELEGPPGSLIRSLELTAATGVRAWSVLYRSTGPDGAAVPVSGMILAPSPPGDTRPVLALAHPTTGLADSCAPSRGGVTGAELEPLLDLVRAGFVVTATDYEGLGTRGIHPYLVGVSEGRSILDSIRAVQALPDAGAGDRAAILGISQGGHAALWAGELVDGYAPELAIIGVVAASPPIDLRAVQRTVVGKGGVGEAAWLESVMVAAAWQSVYDTGLDGLLTGEATRIAGALAKECLSSIVGPTKSPFKVDPESVPEWQALLEANSPGHRASRPPILVLAATGDELVPRATIQLGVDRLCAAGSSVALRWVEGPHAAPLTDPVAAAWARSWVIERFFGRPVVNGCG